MPLPRLPAYFLSHGGGPWPYMKNEFGKRFDKLEASIVDIPRQIGERPRAVLMISGHWEAPEFTVSAGAWPPMVYDYCGFPDYTYRIKYAAPGSPEIATRVQSLLRAGGLSCQLDETRGFDHGTFSIMKPLFPEADVPVVQLALKETLDSKLHIAAGRLLAPLRGEGVLIIGSGSSYHNLQRWNSSGSAASQEFDRWLQETLVHSEPAERISRLINWTGAPSARQAHPREEHLIPLMVAAGAAEEEQCACVFHDDLLSDITLSSFRLGKMAD